MARLALYGNSSGSRNHLDRVSDKTGIVDDARSRMQRKRLLRQNPHQIGSLKKPAGLVKEKTPVEITAPCNTKVSIVRPHRIDRHRAISGLSSSGTRPRMSYALKQGNA